MHIKVKKLHPDAVLPVRAHNTDAGFDLIAIDDGTMTETFIEYKTGIALEPDVGFHTEIFPRSSISKTNLVLANGLGLVDQDYRAEVILRFKVVPPINICCNDLGGMFWEPTIYKKGDRIGQLVVRKDELVSFEWCDELNTTARNLGGFGSTGR